MRSVPLSLWPVTISQSVLLSSTHDGWQDSGLNLIVNSNWSNTLNCGMIRWTKGPEETKAGNQGTSQREPQKNCLYLTSQKPHLWKLPLSISWKWKIHLLGTALSLEVLHGFVNVTFRANLRFLTASFWKRIEPFIGRGIALRSALQNTSWNKMLWYGQVAGGKKDKDINRLWVALSGPYINNTS